MTIGSYTRRLSSAACLGLILASAVACRADWPFARGGADSTGTTTVALPDEPSILWTYETGGHAIETTSVIIDGVAYFGDADGTAHAVSIADGAAVWKQPFGETFFLSPGAIVGDAFLLPDADGTLRCLARSDGSVRWEFDTGSEMYGGPLSHEAEGEPAVLLVPTEGGKLFGLDPTTGDERWAFEIDAPLRGTPTVVSGHAILAGCDGKLHTIEIASGQETGSCDIGGPTGNSAAVIDGTAYFGMEGGEFLAVDAADPAKPTVKWTYRDAKRGQGIRTDAAVTDALVVFANQAKTVFGLSPTDGGILWRARTKSRVEASPLVLAGDRVLIATSRGRLRLLETKSGEETWSYNAGGSFLAAPSASAGCVLIGNTDGLLYCLGAKE